jgi:hypothetical protein
MAKYARTISEGEKRPDSQLAGRWLDKLAEVISVTESGSCSARIDGFFHPVLLYPYEYHYITEEEYETERLLRA